MTAGSILLVVALVRRNIALDPRQPFWKTPAALVSAGSGGGPTRVESGEWIMTSQIRLFSLAATLLVAAAAHAQIIDESLSGHAAVQPGGAPASAPTEETKGPFSWMVPKVTLPKISMPKIEMPKMPANAFAPVKASAAKVKDGARKAWEGTKELLSFGRDKSQPTARMASAQQPSGMGGLFGGREAETAQPQTMSEWISQPRPE